MPTTEKCPVCNKSLDNGQHPKFAGHTGRDEPGDVRQMRCQSEGRADGQYMVKNSKGQWKRDVAPVQMHPITKEPMTIFPSRAERRAQEAFQKKLQRELRRDKRAS